MNTVKFTAHFPIQKSGDKPTFFGTNEYFHVSVGSYQVAVDVPADEIYAVAEANVAITDHLYGWLKSAPKLVKSYPEELAVVLANLDSAARRVVEAIKYFFVRQDIQDNVLGMAANFEWTDVDGEKAFVPIPPEGRMTAHVMWSSGNAAAMQEGFDKGYRPLIGMRHLHRAMQEPEPRFRWIDITIALELAIKEALIRKNPSIELLILELPSPPLTTLYGKIMQQYLGEKSSYLKEIQKGVEVRNKLMHRPDGIAITPEQASDYLKHAQLAVNQVFRLLYPDWPIAQGMEHAYFISKSAVY
jgi:hypothetical protein